MATTFAEIGIDVPSGASGEVKTVCPKCGGSKRKPQNRNDRDLSVNLTEGVWQCWHCDWRGALTSADPNGYGSRLKSYERPAPLVTPQTSLMEAMYRWFEGERGISREIVERHKCVVATRADGKAAIAFPHTRDGEVINVQYRTKDKQFSQVKGAERIFYGLDDITPETTEVIICEGQIDKMSFEMAGYLNVLSVPDGAPNAGTKDYTAKLSYLESVADLFDRMQRVYLAADNDSNGQALNAELARRIGREKCWLVTWREGIKDANDALKIIGAPEITESIALARPFPIEGLIDSADVEDAVFDLYAHGYDPGLRIGLPRLDDHYRVKPGLMSIVTGYSSHGKSLWLDHVLVRLAQRHGWRFLLYSPENMPAHRHYANIVEVAIGKPFDVGPSTRMSPDDLERGTTFMRDHFAWLDLEDPNIDAILEVARLRLLQRGINGLVLDPWNELAHSRPSYKTETEYISEVLGKLRRFARVNDVHVWVLAHPTKPMAGNTSEPPRLWQIAGSMHFWNKADYGLSIWRDPTDPTAVAYCQVEKVRFRETGRPGKVEFSYNAASRQLVEA